MSALLTRDDVEAVVEDLTPAIEAFLLHHAKRTELALRVIDPASPSEAVVLYEKDFGYPPDWAHDYAGIAMGKAGVCLRCKCDSAVAVEQRPHALQPGDPPYAGGVYVEGLVVACSGVEGYFDQMIARWVAAACRAIATHRFQTEVVATGLDAVPAV